MRAERDARSSRDARPHVTSAPRAATQTALCLTVHLNHNALMSEVREHFAQRNEFAFHQTSLVEGDDQEHIYRDAFLAWWMSPRPRPTMRVRALRGRLRALAPSDNLLRPSRAPAPRRTGSRVVCV